jgi:hypothetical protein
MPSDKAPLAVRILRRMGAGSHDGHARGLMRFWPFWERFTLWLWRLQPTPGTIHDSVRVRLMRYYGRPIVLPDGTPVRRGDRVLDVHLHNPVIVRLIAEGSGPWGVLRAVREDMRPIARWVQSEPRFASARALFASSLMSRGAPRLGFVLRDRPVTLTAWMDRLFLEGLLILYTPEGKERLEHGSTFARFPQELWMSRATLLRLYGEPEASETVGSEQEIVS